MSVGTVDIGPLLGDAAGPAADRVAHHIDEACRTDGFFSIVGHGIDPSLAPTVESLAREFFALDDTEKAAVAMERGGRAWRGWFPPGGELTSGRPDDKEGFYFGTELAPTDPRVVAGVPLHGPNLFPERPPGLRDAVGAWIDALGAVAAAVLRGMAVALGLDADYFAREVTAEPTVLFRIFRYPAAGPAARTDDRWGVGEHTDYGLLTILAQDATGGLEVHGPSGWVEVTPEPGALVCNLGDVLERMTAGRYRSTPHRVRRPERRDRISFPYFYDPGWDAPLRALPVPPGIPGPAAAAGRPRWDGADLDRLGGTYGEYLVSKVRRVFPGLGDDVLPGDARPGDG